MTATRMETVEALESLALQFCLAARLTSYPDEFLAGALRQLSEAGATTTEGGKAPALGEFLECARSGPGMSQLQASFLSLFDAGQARVPLYETEYGRMRGMSKGNELADLAGFYRAFGLETIDEDGRREMPDHVSVEMEFYGSLLARQAHLLVAEDHEGLGIVEDARRKFLVDHLGRWVRTVSQQGPVAEHPLYGPVFSWCAGLVEDECERLGAVPAPLDFHGGQGEPDAVCCGALSGTRDNAPPGGGGLVEDSRQ